MIKKKIKIKAMITMIIIKRCPELSNWWSRRIAETITDYRERESKNRPTVPTDTCSY